MMHDADHCTFDTLLSHSRLKSIALDLVVRMVRAADTNRHDQSPKAPGLLARGCWRYRLVCRGFFRDDATQMEAGLPIYEALYRCTRDGYDEGHDSLPEVAA